MKRIYIFGISIYDLLASLLVLILLFLHSHHKYFKNLPKINFIIAAIILVWPLGIIFHIIFGVNTEINSKLGLSYAPIRD